MKKIQYEMHGMDNSTVTIILLTISDFIYAFIPACREIKHLVALEIWLLHKPAIHEQSFPLFRFFVE